MSALTKLSAQVHNQLRSSIIITNLGQLVEELVCNSIDAGAKKIQVFVNSTTCGVQVIDDGHGISRDSLSILGVRHATSKLESLEDLESSPTTLGFRGEALSSIAECALLTVLSRTRGAQPYRKLLKGGNVISLELASTPRGPTRLTGIGTVVDVQDLFFNQPVKRRQLLTQISKEIDDLKERVLRLAFIHTDILFEVFDTIGQRRVLCAPQVRSARELVECIFGDEAASDLRSLDYVVGGLGLSGYISKGLGHATKGLQYLYVNQRFVTNTPLHKLIATRFADTLEAGTSSLEAAQELSLAQGSKRSKRLPSYILNLDCPCSEYDITFEPTKSYVEFKDWSVIIAFFQNALDTVWGATSFALARLPDFGGYCPVSERSQNPGCVLKGESRLDPLEVEGASLVTWFSDTRCPVEGDDEQLLHGSSTSFRNVLSTAAPSDSLFQGLRHVQDSRPSFSGAEIELQLYQSMDQDRSEAHFLKDFGLGSEGIGQEDWVSSSQLAVPFSNSQKINFVAPRRPTTGLHYIDTTCEDTFPVIVSPPSPIFSGLSREKEVRSFDFQLDPPGELRDPLSHGLDEPTLKASLSPFDMHVPSEQAKQIESTGHPCPRNCRHWDSGPKDRQSHGADDIEEQQGVTNRSQAQNKTLPRERSAEAQPSQLQARNERCDKRPVWEPAVGAKKRKRADAWPIQRRPQSAPPFARPRKVHGPKSGATLELKRPAVEAAGMRIAQDQPEGASFSKWRSPQGSEEVQDMYKAWQNPCFKATDKDILMLDADGHPNIIPKEITSNMLQELRVFQQIDRKFIAAMAGDALVIIDQHAADERVRLEELKDRVLGVQGPRSTSSIPLKEAVKVAVTPVDEQVLRTHRRVIEQWGWKYAFEALPQSGGTWNKAPTHAGPVLLTAVPCILNVTLTATDLLEYLQQLQDTRSPSSVPPSIIRLLNSKACRGAIMFGDSLLPGECLQLLKHLQRTHLPFQCAHGRPTMVPLVKMSDFARKYLVPEKHAGDVLDSKPGTAQSSEGQGARMSQSVSGSTAARGLYLHEVALSRARSRLQ